MEIDKEFVQFFNPLAFLATIFFVINYIACKLFPDYIKGDLSSRHNKRNQFSMLKVAVKLLLPIQGVKIAWKIFRKFLKILENMRLSFPSKQAKFISSGVTREGRAAIFPSAPSDEHASYATVHIFGNLRTSSQEASQDVGIDVGRFLEPQKLHHRLDPTSPPVHKSIKLVTLKTKQV